MYLGIVTSVLEVLVVEEVSDGVGIVLKFEKHVSYVLPILIRYSVRILNFEVFFEHPYLFFNFL